MRGNRYLGANFQGIGYFQVQARQLTSSACGGTKKMFILLSTEVLIFRLCSAFETGEEFYSPITNYQFIFPKPHHSHKETEYE